MSNLIFTQLASDNFQRPNENPLSQGGNWTTFSPDLPLQILNNQCTAPSINTTGRELYTGVAFPTNQWVQFTIGGISDPECLVWLRSTGAESAGVAAGYWCDVTINESSCFIGSVINDVNSIYGGFFPPSEFLLGDTFLFSAVGTNLSAYHNGNLILSVSDSTLSSGTVGLEVAAGTHSAALNFTAGSVNFDAIGFVPSFYYNSYEAGLSIYVASGVIGGVQHNGQVVTVPPNAQTYVWVDATGTAQTGTSLGDGYPVALVTSGQIRTSGSGAGFAVGNPPSSGAVQFNDGITSIQDLTVR